MKLNDDELNLLEMVFMDSLDLNREFKDTARDIQKLYIGCPFNYCEKKGDIK